MSTRREFLKILGTAGTAAILSRSAYSQTRAKSCVIIGSGLAGLSAAFKLKNAGWQVTIIEARTRTGGRVFSHSLPQSKDLVCELGAEWVGESHERLKALCKDFNIALQEHRFADDLMQNGRIKPHSQWSFSASAKTGFDKLIAGYEKLTTAQKTALDKQTWWNLLERNGFEPNDLLIRDLMDSTDFGESIRHISAFAALAEYAESSPNNEMDYKMSGGNSRLVNEFATRIGAANIKLGERVLEVNQLKGVVTVKTDKTSYKADACVCTAPVASVKKIKFTPALPAAQSDALDKLVYARIIKNSVLYDNRFWKRENYSLVSDTTSHYYFHSTQNQPGEQGILTAYAIGEKADVLASQDDARRMAVITRDLVDVDKNAPQLARGIASYAWQRDEFTQGAYAVYKPGQWFGIKPVIARPHGKVLFAGEHIADWQGFMEGAIETGEAAADSLIK